MYLLLPSLKSSSSWGVLFWVFVQLRGICLSVVFCTFQGQSTHFIPLIVSEKAKDTKAQPFLFQASSAAKYYLKIGESYIRLDGHRRRGKDTAKRRSEESAATASLDEELECNVHCSLVCRRCGSKGKEGGDIDKLLNSIRNFFGTPYTLLLVQFKIL